MFIFSHPKRKKKEKELNEGVLVNGVDGYRLHTLYLLEIFLDE
jgi:hypothetical protein